MVKKWIIEISSLLLCLLFASTGIDKMVHLPAFRFRLTQSPWTWLQHNAGWFSATLPLAEVILACGLLWPPLRRISFLVSAFLLLAFISYICFMLWSGKPLPCSCGGIISYLSWKAHIWVNLFFVSVALLAWYYSYPLVFRSSGKSQPA